MHKIYFPPLIHFYKYHAETHNDIKNCLCPFLLGSLLLQVDGTSWRKSINF